MVTPARPPPPCVNDNGWERHCALTSPQAPRWLSACVPWNARTSAGWQDPPGLPLSRQSFLMLAYGTTRVTFMALFLFSLMPSLFEKM